MKNLLIITVIILTGCVETTEMMYVCNCQEKEKLVEFIQTSIKSANNMSDEEMEDVIKELRITAIKTHCRYKAITAKYKGKIMKSVTSGLDSCETIMDTY